MECCRLNSSKSPKQVLNHRCQVLLYLVCSETRKYGDTFEGSLSLSFYLGLKRGVCSQINHFPEDADYDQDAAEYLLRESGVFICACFWPIR